jgi:hypothetical protein
MMWEMKMTAHLMDKGLNECPNPDFNDRLTVRESGPFDLTTEEGKKFKEAVDLNKKVMGQFIQAYSTINLINKVNLQKKADKQFPCRKGWKLWKELQEEYNPNDIPEAELKLALSKLQLNKKKNSQKLIEEIASCKVKHGIPVSNSKKVAQLIRLGGKEYGTVITVIQMCKKAEGVTCTSKHIVDKMWKQWQVKGGKEHGKENSDNKEETSLVKADDKTKGKKKKEDKDKKKETRTCNHCQKKGHIEANFRQKDPSKMPKHLWKKKDAKTEKQQQQLKKSTFCQLWKWKLKTS